jgi:putative transposase
MECVRRAVAVEIENPPPELYAVEEPYRRIVEEVAAYVAERGRLEKERGTTSCTAVSESCTPYPPS